VVPFQNCIRHFIPSTKMATTANEFPIGSYVKLSSAVGAIIFEGPNRRTHFWKITIQWLFHQNFVALLLKAALIQVSDYRLLGASGFLKEFLLPNFLEKNWPEKIKQNYNIKN
jgi:hypothetical protein